MEAAPSAKTRREPPPIPPNYVSLRKLQELRLKEQEEKRRREEEAAAVAKREAEAAAAAAAAAAMAATVKRRDAALKGKAKGRAVSWEAPDRGAQAQRHQWAALPHRAAAATPRPTPKCGEVAAVDSGRAVGGGRGKKGPGDVADSAPRGGCKPLSNWKGKGKASLCDTVGVPVKIAEAASAAPDGGKPEDKTKPRAKGKASGDQTAESRSSGGPGEPAKAAASSSRRQFQRKGRKCAGGRSAETSTGDAPAKMTGPPAPRAIKSDSTGTGNDSPDGMKAAPPLACPSLAAEGSSKPTGGGEPRKTVEAKPEGIIEGQRRRLVVEVQAPVAELNPRVAMKWAEPRRGRGTEAAEQLGRVWVPKAPAPAAGSSAGAGL